jgi:hypothetical protein
MKSALWGDGMFLCVCLQCLSNDFSTYILTSVKLDINSCLWKQPLLRSLNRSGWACEISCDGKPQTCLQVLFETSVYVKRHSQSFWCYEEQVFIQKRITKFYNRINYLKKRTYLMDIYYFPTNRCNYELIIAARPYKL